jgi:hypothetical protein
VYAQKIWGTREKIRKILLGKFPANLKLLREVLKYIFIEEHIIKKSKNKRACEVLIEANSQALWVSCG